MSAIFILTRGILTENELILCKVEFLKYQVGKKIPRYSVNQAMYAQIERIVANRPFFLEKSRTEFSVM